MSRDSIRGESENFHPASKNLRTGSESRWHAKRGELDPQVVAMAWAKKLDEINAQHGPVKVIMKNGVRQ